MRNKKLNVGSILDGQLLEDGVLELTTSKDKISENQPNYIGWNVFNFAKLSMLECYYDLFQVVLVPGSFVLCEMDTDSLYMNFKNGKCFEENVRPEIRGTAEYKRLEEEFFITPIAKFGKRTPGKFKIEFEGTKIISLNSKTYAVENENNNSYKFSMKGIQKGQFTENPMGLYESTLNTKSSQSATNRGLKRKFATICQCEQTKIALSYFCGKRKVLEDGNSTVPLDI